MLTSSHIGMNNRRLRRVVSPMFPWSSNQGATSGGSRPCCRWNLFRSALVSDVNSSPQQLITMRTTSPGVPVLVALCLTVCGGAPARSAQPTRTSDLDAFMAQVLARRDENWRKLQQYVLDERERAHVVGPAGARLYGLDREYTWYIRDGVFVRSPVRFDGVTLSEAERQAYEREWIERERQREERGARSGSRSRDAAAAPAAKGAGAATHGHGRPREADPGATVRLVSLLSAFQVRAGPVRPGRTRALRGTHGASNRVLPGAPVFRR